MTDVNLERIGFWGILAIYLIRDGIVPMVRQYVPALSRRSDREQAREDKRLEFEQQMDLRQTEALERIGMFMEQSSERLRHIEEKIGIMPAAKKRGRV